ncbi:MAG: SAM-dependent methyltransferase, partial [Proteobacteria bacterium]|nr:SAM-dependent methyltransferase [Pseudomonadota bacterium]
HGYKVSVTELVGWEHSLKNELIIARHDGLPRQRSADRLLEMLENLGLEELSQRFFCAREP